MGLWVYRIGFDTNLHTHFSILVRGDACCRSCVAATTAVLPWPEPRGAHKGRARPTSARGPTRAQGGAQGPGPQRPRRAHKGPGGPQGPGPQMPRGAHKGPAHKCPRGPTRARPMKAQDGQDGPTSAQGGRGATGPQWPRVGHKGPAHHCRITLRRSAPLCLLHVFCSQVLFFSRLRHAFTYV